MFLYSVVSSSDSRSDSKANIILGGGLGGTAGICTILLVYRWRRRRRQQANTLHPEPFGATLTGGDQSMGVGIISSGLPQKFAREEVMTASESLERVLQMID